jgi:hypothetical protein
VETSADNKVALIQTKVCKVDSAEPQVYSADNLRALIQISKVDLQIL